MPKTTCATGLNLDRAEADGRISTGDADEVRNFASFLTATAGLPKSARERTDEQQAAFIAAYREHYPEGFKKARADAARDR